MKGGIYMVKILFVCLGNICRSPMAEAYFKKIVDEAGLSDRFTIDSAGTSDWNVGKPPHQGTQEKLSAYDIPFDHIKSRQIGEDDFNSFDYIIAMDDQNITDLTNIKIKGTNTKLTRLMDFVEDEALKDIPDPYYTGDFDQTYELVQAGCQSLLKTIRAKHQF